MNLETLRGDWALITGASSGIGQAFAECLAALGMKSFAERNPVYTAFRRLSPQRIIAALRPLAILSRQIGKTFDPEALARITG